ncbi:thermonuclease family protein [Hazenella coriacea]|uniref:Micrococcal nuclease n=1 Tax=Hazenella coriacea TaxID=1179467 RepID=A0A4R3L9F3_9BACL|nr:thermonuclease family protein [Hazenella coriacea]TCS95740.1 micrococcal nuclease [Hazenella coriacea]
MKTRITWIGILILLCTGCNMDTWDVYDEGDVIKTIDGDTVEVKTKGGRKYTVDLALIRTPIVEDPFGKQAIKVLQGYEDKWFDVEIRAEKQADGTYKGFVIDLMDNQANRDLVKEGLAIVKVEGKGLWSQIEIDEYLAAQEAAKKKKKGIWSIDGYVKNDEFDTELANKVFAEKLAEEKRKKS